MNFFGCLHGSIYSFKVSALSLSMKFQAILLTNCLLYAPICTHADIKFRRGIFLSYKVGSAGD
jgi:predicted metal-binding protein